MVIEKRERYWEWFYGRGNIVLKQEGWIDFKYFLLKEGYFKQKKLV